MAYDNLRSEFNESRSAMLKAFAAAVAAGAGSWQDVHDTTCVMRQIMEVLPTKT